MSRAFRDMGTTNVDARRRRQSGEEVHRDGGVYPAQPARPGTFPVSVTPCRRAGERAKAATGKAGHTFPRMGKQIIAPSGHNMQLEAPQAVSDAIQEVVQECRKKK